MVWFQWYVLLNVLIITLLALNVSLVRISEKIPNGDGKSIRLKKSIRTHMNGVEQVIAFGLVLLALAQSASDTLLAGLVITFTASRVVHMIGMFQVIPILRMGGAALTYLCQLAGLIALAWLLI